MELMTIFAQVAPVITDSIVEGNPVLTPVVASEESLSLWDMALKGGWIMLILGILSLICFYILFERNYVIRSAAKEDPKFMDKIKDYIQSGEVKAALSYCRGVNTPSARMIEKGISRLGRPAADVQTAIENAGNIEVAKLEKGLTIMATISSGAHYQTANGSNHGFVDTARKQCNVNVISRISHFEEGAYHTCNGTQETNHWGTA